MIYFSHEIHGRDMPWRLQAEKQHSWTAENPSSHRKRQFDASLCNELENVHEMKRSQMNFEYLFLNVHNIQIKILRLRLNWGKEGGTGGS